MFAPGLMDYLTTPAPAPSYVPNAAGKIPQIGFHPSATDAGNDILNLLTSLAPSGAVKGAAVGGLGAMARRGAEEAAPSVERWLLHRQMQQQNPLLGSAPANALRDEAQRLARANEGGFYLNMPLGHGTAPLDPFAAFDPARSGATSSSAPAAQGVFAEVRPQSGGIADEFAGTAAQRTGGNPQVMPLVHRADRPGVIQLQGDEQNHEIAATLADAWARGHDAVMLKNYTSPGGKSGDILVVKDPAQLRSPYAQFDPAKRDSTDLLAGLGGLSALPPAALASLGLMPQDRQ